MAEIVKMPKLGSTMESGVLCNWCKEVGDEVKRGDSICEIETEKLVTAVESMYDGVMLQHIGEIGNEYTVGEPICIIGKENESINIPKPADDEKEDQEVDFASKNENREEAVSASDRIKISPLAKKIARENGIDYTKIKGSSVSGRIEKKDVLKFMSETKENSQPKKKDDVSIDMNGMRKAIAKKMTASKQMIPHTYFKTNVDMGDLMKFRFDAPKHLETKVEKYGINALILKAAAVALHCVKGINVSLNDNAIVTHNHINIGMAVSVSEGLVVPVIKDVDKLSIVEIDKKAAELARKARENELVFDDLSDSTFTVSSLSRYGLPEFTAIINPPNAAILAVGAVLDEVVAVKGEVCIRPILHATLSIDHRVIDGALAAQYLSKFKEVLENPYMLLGGTI